MSEGLRKSQKAGSLWVKLTMTMSMTPDEKIWTILKKIDDAQSYAWESYQEMADAKYLLKRF